MPAPGENRVANLRDGIKSGMRPADICPAEVAESRLVQARLRPDGLTSSGTGARVTAVQRFPRSTSRPASLATTGVTYSPTGNPASGEKGASDYQRPTQRVRRLRSAPRCRGVDFAPRDPDRGSGRGRRRCPVAPFARGHLRGCGARTRDHRPRHITGTRRPHAPREIGRASCRERV